MQTLTVPGVVRGASAPAVGESVMTGSCLYEGRGPLRVDVAGREWEPQGLPRHTCSEAPTDHTALEQANHAETRHDPNGTRAPGMRSSAGKCASKQQAPPPTVASGFTRARAAWRAARAPLIALLQGGIGGSESADVAISAMDADQHSGCSRGNI